VANKTSTKSGGARRTSTKNMKKSTSRSTKAGLAKAQSAMSTESAGDEEVAMDRRRGLRRDEEAVAVPVPAAGGPQLERRKKVNRRRQIDPTTCERDYTDQEVEFMNALDDYKRKSGRMFPTCSEVLEVLRGLGYVKLSAMELDSRPVDDLAIASAKPMPSNWPVTAADASDEVESLINEVQLIG
jgi:hypothetical protein